MNSTINKPTLPPYVRINERKETRRGASRAEINRVAQKPSETQVTVAGQGETLPIIYGRAKVGGKICTVTEHQNHLLVLVAFAGHQVKQFEQLVIDNKVFTSDMGSVRYHDGTQTTADPWLKAAISDYNDVLTGISYVVLRLKPKAVKSLNTLAIIQGDPLTYYANFTGYRYDSAALVLGHFVTTYAGLSYEATSFRDAIAHCNQTMSDGKPRNSIGLVIDKQDSALAWLKVLAEYAGCYYYIVGNVVHFVVNKPRTSKWTFDGSNIIQDSSNHLSRPAHDDVPNQVMVQYTQTHTKHDKPWVTAIASTPYPTETPVVSTISLPGIQSKSQAMRVAIERLNRASLSDLRASILVNEAAKHAKVGDVCTVTQRYGVRNKPMEIIDIEPVEPSRYRLQLAEYDPLVFSNKVETEPTFADTNLDDATNMPALTAASWSVEQNLAQFDNGQWKTSIFITYTESPHPFAKYYEFRVIHVSSGKVVENFHIYGAGVIQTMFLAEYETYKVAIRVRSTIDTVSPWSTKTIKLEGKKTPPTNVTGFQGFEAGGEVFLEWEAAQDLDLVRYELQYMPVGHAWNGQFAKRLNYADTTRFSTKDIPAGEWDIAIKAQDSVGNFSVTEARLKVNVTLDDDAYLATTYEYQYYTLENMYPYRIGGDVYYVTYHPADTWANTFTKPLGEYTRPLATYHRPVDSSVTTETKDLGHIISGDFVAKSAARAISGTFTESLDVSKDNQTFTKTPTVARTAARYAKYMASATGESTLVVKRPVTLELSAQTRNEKGTRTSSATSVTRITLRGRYYKVLHVGVTSIRGLNAQAIVDDVVVGLNRPNYFDVIVIDQNRNRLAADFTYKFEGV